MKKNWKRYMSCGLAVAMVLSMTSCGKDKDNGGSGSSSSTGGATAAEMTASSKEGVFSESEIDIEGLASDISIYSSYYYDDEGKIYFVNQSYMDMDTTYQLISVSKDDMKGSSVSLELPVKAAASSNNAASGGVELRDFDSAIAEGETFELTGGDTLDDDYSYSADDSYEYVSYGNFTFTADKTLIGICSHTHSVEGETDADGNSVTRTDYYECFWNLDGTVKNYYLMEFLGGDGWLQNMFVGENQRITIIWYSYDSGEYTQYIVGADAVLEKQGAMKSGSIFENISSTLILKDGRVLACYYDYSGDNYDQKLVIMDVTNGDISTEYPIPDNLKNDGMGAIYIGATYDIITTTDKAVWGFNLGDTTATKIMDYVNSDLNSSYMNTIMQMDADHFIGVYYDNDTWATHLGLFTYILPENVKDKTVLTIGAFYLGTDIRKKIVEFNKTNDQYRFVIKEYEDSSAEDYNEGYTKLNNDILAGNMPDILYVNSSSDLDLNAYVNKGLVANVDELIANDSEISGQKYLSNVFDAFRIDGKLYYLIPSFEIRTYFAKTSIVGNKTSWTMDEFLQVLNSMSGSNAFDLQTRSGFITELINYCGSDFVNLSTGKCEFNSDTFIKALEYAATLPEEINYDELDESYWDNNDTQYLDNRTLLMQSYMYDLKGYNTYVKGYFGEEITPIGFPTESGEGSIIAPYEFYLLSAKSKNLDGAWSFIRELLLPEYQDSIEYEIPVLESSFDKWAEKATKKSSYDDGMGGVVEYDDTLWLNDHEVVIEPMTAADIETMKTYIKSVTKPLYYNESVYNIILEEASSFFAGQKSAKEVADIIQSRVQIYVSENS